MVAKTTHHYLWRSIHLLNKLNKLHSPILLWILGGSFFNLLKLSQGKTTGKAIFCLDAIAGDGERGARSPYKLL